jgi:HEAT repeat protein
MSWLLPPLPPHYEAALRDVTAKRPESRMAAAERLGHAEGDERERAYQGLITLSNDEHPDVRATALAALGMLGDARAFDSIVPHLQDVHPAVREFATLAIGQLGGEPALAALREALQNSAPEVRFQAVTALAELAPESADHDILPLLSDSDAEVREQAVAALSSLSEPHLAGHFAFSLEDANPRVQLEAALALASMEDARGEHVLLTALVMRERVPEVADALARIHATRACEHLARIALAFLPAPDVRAAASAALVRLGDPRGIDGLRRVLRGLRSDARSYAVHLAGEADALPLVPELVRLSERPRGADPFTIVTSLAKFAARSPAARNALSKLAGQSDDVGEAARRALGTLES